MPPRGVSSRRSAFVMSWSCSPGILSTWLPSDLRDEAEPCRASHRPEDASAARSHPPALEASACPTRPCHQTSLSRSRPVRDAVLANQLTRLRTRFVLPEDTDNLLLNKFRSFHCPSSQGPDAGNDWREFSGAGQPTPEFGLQRFFPSSKNGLLKSFRHC